MPLPRKSRNCDVPVAQGQHTLISTVTLLRLGLLLQLLLLRHWYQQSRSCTAVVSGMTTTTMTVTTTTTTTATNTTTTTTTTTTTATTITTDNGYYDTDISRHDLLPLLSLAWQLLHWLWLNYCNYYNLLQRQLRRRQQQQQLLQLRHIYQQSRSPTTVGVARIQVAAIKKQPEEKNCDSRNVGDFGNLERPKMRFDRISTGICLTKLLTLNIHPHKAEGWFPICRKFRKLHNEWSMLFSHSSQQLLISLLACLG